jgi:hypothetical protein
MSALAGFALQRPPDLSSEHIGSFTAAIEAEAARLGTSDTREVTRREHVRIVFAEAWLTHLDELCIYEGSSGLCVGTDMYIGRLATNAAIDIHALLTARVPVWGPTIWRPRPLHRAVAYLIDFRIQSRGGGCEICHADVHLDPHHLHYRSFGYEVPSDVMRLCRSCHKQRHRICGYPQDVRWKDSMQWTP